MDWKSTLKSVSTSKNPQQEKQSDAPSAGKWVEGSRGILNLSLGPPQEVTGGRGAALSKCGLTQPGLSCPLPLPPQSLTHTQNTHPTIHSTPLAWVPVFTMVFEMRNRTELLTQPRVAVEADDLLFFGRL